MIKLPVLESILFFIVGLIGFPILGMAVIVVIATLGDPLLQRFKWFKTHANNFPTNYKESLFMNGCILLAYILGFLVRFIFSLLGLIK